MSRTDRERVAKLKLRMAHLMEELSALKWAIDFIELQLDIREDAADASDS